MAYFANGSDGARFERECGQCKLGEGPCPIYEVQVEHNYDAINNKMATSILTLLVKNDGTCEMLRRFPEVLKKD